MLAVWGDVACHSRVIQLDLAGRGRSFVHFHGNVFWVNGRCSAVDRYFILNIQCSGLLKVPDIIKYVLISD